MRLNKLDPASVSGYWLFGPIICNLYVTADVLMCTASILHLCTISLDRYMAIRSPLTTRNISKSVVVIKLAIVWATSIAISSPITILGFINESNVFSNQHCALSNGNFKIYGSVCAFFIPLLIMVLSYGLTLYTLISQSQKLHAQGKENEQPVIRRSLSRKPLKRGTRVRFQTRNRSNHHQEEADEHLYTPIINRKSIPKTLLHSSMENMCETSSQKGPCATSPLIDNHHQSRKIPQKEFSMSDSSCHLNIDHGSNDQSKEIMPWTRTRLILPNGHTSNLRGLVRKHQLVLKATSILLMKKTHIKKLDDVHTEQKASKVIGIVFIIFVVCWAPFFILNIMTPLCKDCRIQPALFASFNWLGYVSSTLNPIIYTMFNKTFKLTFKKLLLCRYDRIQRKQRVQSWMVSNGSLFHNGSDSNNSIDKCDTPCWSRGTWCQSCDNCWKHHTTSDSHSGDLFDLVWQCLWHVNQDTAVHNMLIMWKSCDYTCRSCVTYHVDHVTCQSCENLTGNKILIMWQLENMPSMWFVWNNSCVDVLRKTLRIRVMWCELKCNYIVLKKTRKIEKFYQIVITVISGVVSLECKNKLWHKNV